MDASVAFLLNNVKELIQYHVELNSEAGNELNSLQTELEAMKSKLKDVSDDHDKGYAFKDYEREMKEVVYEVEDVIDEFITQSAVEKASSSRLFGRANMSKFINKTQLAEKVKHLRTTKVKPLFQRAQTEFAKLGDPSHRNTGNQIVDKRDKVPRTDKIVGFEDEIRKILDCLRAPSEKLEVTSISGMPGLGKTTVAWKIYTDQDLQFEFPIRIWVNVSQAFNKMDVLLKILKELTFEDMSELAEDKLVEEVKMRLGGRKILLFLDDVWDDWKAIQSFLPDNKLCKVLVTTRHEAVGWAANRNKGPYKLRKLNPEESWELLKLEVGDEVFAEDTRLLKIAKDISRHCDGLPLSIIIIGGIMVDKIGLAGGPRETLWEEWHKISVCVETSINRDDSLKRMENIIALSYTQLEYDFRDCFLYLGMFPSGAEIPAWKLTKMWIAEGFVPEKWEMTPEQVADDILKELVSRNLLMVRETKMNGHVKTCRIHDTIREFCKNIAGPKNQNLFQEIKLSKVKGVFDPPPASMKRCRRLCIHSHLQNLLAENIKVPNARTFLCFSKDEVHLKDVEIQPMTEAFSLLRVFEAGTIKFPKTPSALTNLHHLRYITLSVPEMDTLPAPFSGLWNLQTLTIETTKLSLTIKADLWKMVQLRHLKTKASIVLSKMNEKGTGGPNMQTLAMLSTQSCTDKVLKRVKNLTALGICGDLPELLKSMSFKTFSRLQKLKLVNKVHLRVSSENPLPELPEPKNFPPNLRILTLSDTHLEWKNMSVLQNLDKLMVLKLKESAFVGDTWNVAGGGFSFLDTLYINDTDLETWTATDDAFPILKNLTIKSCRVLVEAPFSQLKNLEMLSLEGVTEHAVSSAMKVEKAKRILAGEQGITKRNFQLSIAPGDKFRRS